MQNDSPWKGLTPRQADSRRVEAGGRWNWFWSVLPPSDLALVLQLTALPSTATLPKLQALEIRFQTTPSGPVLYLRLKDRAQAELFETLCRDVIAASETATSEAEALERAIGRTFRWHRLLRGGRPDVLTEEEQKGLIGELRVLRLLIEALDPKAALDAWMGPSGAPKDFETESLCIEVKARRGAAQPFVKISNEFQLADVPGRDLALAILAVDLVQPPHGLTLTDHVAEVASLLPPDCHLDWDLHLADAGYDPDHDYTPWRWIASAPVFHAVTEGFPRLSLPPVGVSAVTYALSLAACAPFERPWEDISAPFTEVPT